MELETIIKHRRNIKPQFFTSDVIPDQEIKDILESANWAPTHGFTEPWRFVVFSGSSRQDFATFQSDTYRSKATSESFQKIKYDKLLSTPPLASHIIAVVVKNTEHTKIPFLEEIVAVSCSVQNILLSAAEKNIAVHWTTGGVTYSDEMKIYLGFEKKDTILGFLYLGRSNDKINQKGNRRSGMENKIIWK